MNPISEELILKMRRTVTERCRDRIELASKVAKEKIEKEEYGITNKRKKEFIG